MNPVWYRTTAILATQAVAMALAYAYAWLMPFAQVPSFGSAAVTGAAACMVGVTGAAILFGQPSRDYVGSALVAYTATTLATGSYNPLFMSAWTPLVFVLATGAILVTIAWRGHGDSFWLRLIAAIPLGVGSILGGLVLLWQHQRALYRIRSQPWL